MGALGPFEISPVLAVGVSGGADSLALTMLADGWAQARGGRAVGLTVDHGLRDASAAEAQRVGEWLRARGIEHHVLPWRHEERPASGVQARARDARRALLTDWCRSNGILHLLLAHHRDDQLETVSMRATRAPSGEGLAGMSGIAEMADIRILRPLLPVPRGDIEALLGGLGQPWIDDPSNRDRRFERVRVRQALAEETDASREGRCRDIAGAGRARAHLDDAVADLVGRAVEMNPAGFARVGLDTLRTTERETGMAVLGRLVRTVSGAGYVPKSTSLDAVYRGITDARQYRGGTLGGCRLIGEGARLLICREPAAVAPDVPLTANTVAVWDRRFQIQVGATPVPGCRIGALGADGWRRIKAAVTADIAAALPHAVRLGLPALKDADGVLAVPHLTYRRPGTHVEGNREEEIQPIAAETVTKARFFVASGRE